ncbi:hypothetical protein [Wukongibacter baidiensis]
MRKKLFYIITIILSLIICTSCSSDGKYNKLINSAEEAVNQWNFGEAAGYYEDIIALKPNSFEDGENRIKSAETSLQNVKRVLENIDNFKAEYEKTIENAENIKFELENINDIKEINDKVVELQDDFYGLPNTKPVKKLEEIRTNIENGIKNELIEKTMGEFATCLEESQISDAETKLQELYSLTDSFSYLKEIDLPALEEQLKEEKDRYLEIPIDVVKRNSLLYEDELGKITFLGEGKRNNSLDAFIKYEGDYKDVAKKIKIKTNFTLASGKHVDDIQTEFVYFDNYSVGIIHLSDDVNDSVEKIKYIDPFDSNKTDEFRYDDSDIKMVKLPPVYKYPTKELETNIVMEDENKKVEIKKLIFNKEETYSSEIINRVTVEAVFTPKEEIDWYGFDRRCYLYDPVRKNISKSAFSNDSFTKDFEHDVNFTFKIPEIQGNTEYLTVYFKDLRTNIDLNTGEEYASDQEKLDQIFVKNIGYSTELSVNIDYWGRLLKDRLGKASINTLQMDGGQGRFNTSRSEVELVLGNMFNKLTVDVAVAKTTMDENYSDSKVDFMNDDVILKTVKIPENLDTISVEVPVKDMNILTIKVKHDSSDGQRILLKNGILHK